MEGVSGSMNRQEDREEWNRLLMSKRFITFI
jgi:hypothetical protein